MILKDYPDLAQQYILIKKKMKLNLTEQGYFHENIENISRSSKYDRKNLRVLITDGMENVKVFRS